MTEREKAQKLYAGKTFYVKNPDGTLDGPRDDIYYVNRNYTNYVTELFSKIKRFASKGKEKEYRFLQVINGTPVQAFTEDEIVVVQHGK